MVNYKRHIVNLEMLASTRCPICKGLGHVTKINSSELVNLLNRSVCPACVFYRNENLCPAWRRSAGYADSDDWIFMPEHSCEILRILIRTLNSAGIADNLNRTV